MSETPSPDHQNQTAEPSAPVSSRPFRDARLESLAEFRALMLSDDWTPVPCVWQDAHGDAHVAAYCNLLSHLDALCELLTEGTWCDDVLLPADFDSSDGAERIFRFLTIVYFALDECFEDCRDILRAAGGPALSGDSQRIMRFINRVWKHRGSRGHGAGSPAFHSCAHHGPYHFEDDSFETPVAPDGIYISVDHWPPAAHAGAVPILVPSIKKSFRALGVELHAITVELADAAARSRIEAAWGSVTLDD